MSDRDTQRKPGPNRLLVVWLVVALVHGAAVGWDQLRGYTPIPVPEEIPRFVLEFLSPILIVGTGIWLLGQLLGRLWRWGAATEDGGDGAKRRAGLIAVITLILVGSTFLNVPVRCYSRWRVLTPAEKARADKNAPMTAGQRRYLQELVDGEPEFPLWPPRFVWIWDRLVDYPFRRISTTEHLRWEILGPMHALILLFGGGLLAFMVRRDRRRRAVA